MGIETGIRLKGFRSGWSVPPNPCDGCRSAPAAVFCRTDSPFLCIACDNKISSANKLASRHERVWICEVCEQGPASVTCKAEAAALCVTCDSDIHSANPLARRHDRVPVEPSFDSADSVSKASAAFNFAVTAVATATDDGFGSDVFNHVHNDREVVSWLVDNPPGIRSGELSFTEMDTFLDFDYSNSFQNNNCCAGNDSVVPVQSKTASVPLMNHRSAETCFDIYFCRSKLSSFNYPTQSLSQSVSSLEVGVVPEGSSVSEISYPSACNSQASQLCVMDREARVLRYREKRKNRKFEKTIRYASRKAYAETRPRIKGRFAKRTEIEWEMDRPYSSAAAPAVLMVDARYGIVPSF